MGRHRPDGVRHQPGRHPRNRLPPAGRRPLQPGFLASILLHTPLGVTYFRALHAEGGESRSDIAKGIAFGVAFALVGVVGPNVVMDDKNSPYPFTRHQLGHHAGELRPATGEE